MNYPEILLPAGTTVEVINPHSGLLMLNADQQQHGAQNNFSVDTTAVSVFSPNGSGQITEHQCNRHLLAVGDAVYVIGGKWKLKLIIALKDGNKRFNELQRAVAGISARVLSAELKDLEMNGFVTRNVYPNTPVVVEYVLTSYSETLEPVILALGNWGHRHREKVMADARSAKEPVKLMMEPDRLIKERDKLMKEPDKSFKQRANVTKESAKLTKEPAKL